MSDRQSVLRAILEDPAEDLHRWAFADLLEEEGDQPRAEFIRWQLKGAALAPDCSPRALRQRQEYSWRAWLYLHALQNRRPSAPGLPPWRARYGDPETVYQTSPHSRGVAAVLRTLSLSPGPPWGWLERHAIVAGLSTLTFHRGMAERWFTPMDGYLAAAADLFRTHPVCRVHVIDRQPSNGAWRRAPSPSLVMDLIVAEVFDHLPGRPTGETASYPTSRAAADALGTACVAYGRSLAGLPPLPAP